MPAKASRTYSPIWNTIKRKKLCIIEVHPAIAARVRKGVISEKYKDTSFKFVNDNDEVYLKITTEKISLNIMRIKFELKQRIGLEPLAGVGFE